MRIENVQMICRSRQNHTGLWFEMNMDAFSSGSAKAAYLEQIERFQNAFTLDQAEQLFSDVNRSE